jgi:transposase
MLVVETIAKIRRAHFSQGKSIKEICRELRVSRKVVRKVIRSDATEFRYERSRQPLPRIGPWREALETLLSENENRSARERLTIIRLYEELRGLGYDGSYAAVRRYVIAWREGRTSRSAAAFVPLSFAAGEAYQFDWSHEIVVMNGVTVTVKVAHMRLCHSRMFVARAYPRETQEMVFDAHERAFAFFKGACARGIYDNMKTAVDTIFVGKDRQYNRRFLQMCSHHLVEPVACTPASGWEKGQVENQVGLVRERFFAPRLKVRNYDELNAVLTDKCVAYAKIHAHPERPDTTIWTAFEEERPHLVPYRGRFDGFHAVQASVSKTCLVRFDNNKYSVSASAVGRPVEIHAYADRVVIRQDGRIVAEHARCYGRGETIYDPWHYVPVLSRKPGALRNGAPFKDWVLPASLERVRRKLAGSDDGDRQMVAILAAALTDGLPAIEAACIEALADGVHSADVILNILARRRDPPPIGTIATPASLMLRHAPIADCAKYDALRRD